MVEVGIEVGFFVICIGYFNVVQIIVLFVVGCLFYFFKILVGYFCFYIFFGFIYVGGGYGYFYQQFFFWFYVKSSDDVFFFFSFGYGQIQGIYDGMIEFYNKKVILVYLYVVVYMFG